MNTSAAGLRLSIDLRGIGYKRLTGRDGLPLDLGNRLQKAHEGYTRLDTAPSAC